MREKINEEVTVIMYYKSKTKQVVPHLLSWRNKEYLLGKVDNYHNYMEGRERQHIFELCDINETLWFRLRLDGSNLHWVLEVIHDGLPN